MEEKKKGIDIEVIKEWIENNTDKLVRHKELKHQLEKHLDERERIEDDMILEGEKLSEFMLLKERKELEKTELETIISGSGLNFDENSSPT